MSKFSIRPVFKNNIKDSSTIPVKKQQKKLDDKKPEDVKQEDNEEFQGVDQVQNNEQNNDQKDQQPDPETDKKTVSKGFPPRANLLRGFRTPTAMRGYGIRKTPNSVIDCL